MKKSKGIWIVAVLALCCFVGAFAAGCKKTKITPSSSIAVVTVTPATLSLDLHESKQLTATKSNTVASIVWSSADTGVVTVDQNGTVTAVGAGQTAVTATAGTAKGTCVVTVANSGSVPVLSLDTETLAVNKGATAKLNASVLYKGAEVASNVSFAYVGDENEGKQVATFVKDGNSITVTGVDLGYTAVKVSAIVYDVPLTKTVYVKCCNTAVTFAVANSERLTPSAIGYTVDTFDSVSYTAEEATEATFNSFTPSVTPSGNASGTSVTWSSADASIVAVNKTTGEMTGKSIGETVVTAKCDGNFVNFNVSVRKAEVELKKGTTVELAKHMGSEKNKEFQALRDTNLGRQETDKAGITVNGKTWSQNFSAFQSSIDSFTTDLTVNSTVTLQVSDLLGSKAADEQVQSVVIPWFEVNEDSTDTNGKFYFTRNTAVTTKDLLVSGGYNASAKTVTLLPPHTAINMGDIMATVTTDKAVYTVPLHIYTMVINNANDLDCFPALTKYQWSNNFLWDGYFVLGQSFTYSTKFWVDESYNNPAQTNWWKNSCDRVFKSFIKGKITGEGNDRNVNVLIGKDGTESTVTNGARPGTNSKEMVLSGFRGVFDGKGHTIKNLAIAQESNMGTGLIGKLYGSIVGSMEVQLRDRGRIENLGLIDCAGKDTAILCFANAGICRNIYAQSRWMTQASLLNRRDWTGSKQVVENVVFHSTQQPNSSDMWYKDECVVNYVGYGKKEQYGGEYSAYIQNVYKIAPAANTLDAIKFGEWPQNKQAFNDTTPEKTFATAAALKAYMQEKGLAVDAENGWNMDYWTTDDYGAPIFKSAQTMLSAN